MNKFKKIIEKIIYVLSFKRIKRGRILFEGTGKYDNSWVLYNYCLKNRPDLKCTFYIAETKVNGKTSIRLMLKKIMHLFTIASYEIIFNSYGYFTSANPKTKKVFLGHGIAYKKVLNTFNNIAETGTEFVLPSDVVINQYSKTYSMNKCTFFKALAPRIDLFEFDEKIASSIDALCNRSHEEKIIGVLLTFRRKENSFDLDVNNVVPFDIDYNKLNDLLKKNNLKLVFKLHHMFDDIYLNFSSELSNIYFIKNKTFVEQGVEATSFMGCCDALVTDYSSAAIDYLLLNRPIFFYNGDFDKFKNNPTDGFLWEDVNKLTPGEKFVNQDEFEMALIKFSNGLDTWMSSRVEVCEFLNGVTFATKNCCKNIIDHYCPKEKYE